MSDYSAKAVLAPVFNTHSDGECPPSVTLWNIFTERWEEYLWIPSDKVMASMSDSERTEIKAFFNQAPK